MWAMKSIDNYITWELQRDIANYCCLLSNDRDNNEYIDTIIQIEGSCRIVQIIMKWQ